MPRGDRSGPMGMGPGSGRAAGFCAGYNTPGFLNRFFGGGFGRGAGTGFGYGRGGGNRGGGFGWRNMFWNTGLPGWMRSGSYSGQQREPDAGMEKQFLENQVEVLKSQLDQMQKRLSELETAATDK